MALTNKQMEGALNLFVTSFMNETEETERKKLYYNLEDVFGKGIPYWKKLCRKLMQNKNVNDRVLEYYDEIVNRGETSYIYFMHERMVLFQQLGEAERG